MTDTDTWDKDDRARILDAVPRWTPYMPGSRSYENLRDQLPHMNKAAAWLIQYLIEAMEREILQLQDELEKGSVKTHNKTGGMK